MASTDWTLEQCAQVIFPELDLRHYPGKWRQARRLVLHDHPELSGQSYWLRVRLTFLELGGGLRRDYTGTGNGRR